MTRTTIFRITFLSGGEVYEIYARKCDPEPTSRNQRRMTTYLEWENG